MNISLAAICVSLNILDLEFSIYNRSSSCHYFHWLRALLHPPTRSELGLQKPRPVYRLHRLIRFLNWVQPRWLIFGQTLTLFFVAYVFIVAIQTIRPWWLFIAITCPGHAFFFSVLVYCIWPSLVTLFAVYALAAGIVFIALDTQILNLKAITFRSVREMISIIIYSQKCNRMFQRTLAIFDSGEYMLFIISAYVGLFAPVSFLLSTMLLSACVGTFILMIYPTFFVNELLTNRLNKFKMRIYSQSSAQLFSIRMALKTEVILDSKAEFTFFTLFRYSNQALLEVRK